MKVKSRFERQVGSTAYSLNSQFTGESVRLVKGKSHLSVKWYTGTCVLTEKEFRNYFLALTPFSNFSFRENYV